MAEWTVVAETTAYDVPVKKYKSQKTGIHVVIAHTPGPLVNGIFALATEAHDDDGLPHTLEHLVFLGSDGFPYKGLLDLLANRCFAQGTNAWTDTDHTAYTCTTAGQDGFLNLMPVFVEHVLFATCTESGFVTEVHHINGEGEDAGVVYCEMQARENTDQDKAALAFVRAMYPGDSGYKSETGGLLANLRDSCSHTKCKNFHQEFYRPENLVIVVVGAVDAERVFAALEPIQKKIVERNQWTAPFTRPWMTPVAPLTEPADVAVAFPSDDESSGLVKLGWRGPPASERAKCVALNVLWDYLTDSSVSPLQREFVENEEPLCTEVSTGFISNLVTCQYLEFYNVEVDAMAEIKPRLLEVLGAIASGAEPIDMPRMQAMIQKQKLTNLRRAEESPDHLFAFAAIDDFLYGQTAQDLVSVLSEDKTLDALATEPAAYWAGLLAEVVASPMVVVTATPSAALAEELAAEERARVDARRTELGEAGLAKLRDGVEAAIKANNVEPPEDVIRGVPVPDVKGIQFHPLLAVRNQGGSARTEENAHIYDQIAGLPVPFEFDAIQSGFVNVTAVCTMADVPAALVPYTELLCELVFESPIQRGDVLVPFEDVVAGLNTDTLKQAAHPGFNSDRFMPGELPQTVVVSLSAPKDKYDVTVRWLSECLCKSVFTAERVKVSVAKIKGDIVEKQREGRAVCKALIKNLLHKEGSVHHGVNLVRQEAFLTGLEALLEDPEGADKVTATLNELRAALLKSIRINVSGNEKLLASIDAPWRGHFLPLLGEASPSPSPVVRADAFKRTDFGGKAVLVGLGAVDSGFLYHTCESIGSFDHADLPALMVLNECMCALEGPFWKGLRGNGLLYGYRMHIEVEEGILYLALIKSANVAKAHQAALSILKSYESGENTFSALAIEAAISSVIFEVIEREQSPKQTAQEALKAFLLNKGDAYNHALLRRVQQVTADDLTRALKLYIAPLLDPASSAVTVVCNAGKAEGIYQSLKTTLPTLEMKETLEQAISL